MNYFEFRDKRPALDVIEWPQIEVSEKQLTDEEIEQWKNLTREGPPSGPFSSCAVWCSGQSSSTE